MNLCEALRLNGKVRLALVGAGGKSSTLFRLAHELKLSGKLEGSTVWLSSTTHLSQDQLIYADRHVEINSLEDFRSYLEAPSPGIILFTGPRVEEERTAGLPSDFLDQIKIHADLKKIPLILEADGSRRLSLKAPAEHEPVIPAWIEQVVVVAGLSALGKPLGKEWVHRPENFSKLSGLSLGELVTREGLLKVLVNPLGGLKGIPDHARKMILFNQVYSEAQQEDGSWMASRLLGDYHSVIMGQLLPPLGIGKILSVQERVAGIILAAGGSTRLGRPKQLLEWRAKTLVQHVASLALNAGLAPVIVVTGCASQEVSRSVQDLPVSIVENPNWQTGQGLSVAAGIKALPAGIGAALLFLVDQPLIPIDLVKKLVTSHAKSLDKIIAPQVNSRRSNPVLFDCSVFNELSLLDEDIGGRALFKNYPVSLMPWSGAPIDIDIDTEEDYLRLLSIKDI